MGKVSLLRVSLLSLCSFLSVAALIVSAANCQQLLNLGSVGSGMALDESILVISNAGPLLAGQSLRVVSDQTLSQSNSFSLVDLRAVGGGTEAAANPNAGLARISTGNAIIGAGGISNVSGVVNISVNTGILSNVSSAASLALNITNMTRAQ